MKANEFNNLLGNTIKTTKNSLIAILIKLFNENHNADYEIVFKEQSYYSVPDGFCYPKRMWLNVNHRLVIERDFDWDDMTTDWEEICVDDMDLFDLLRFCEDYINEYFNKIIA